MMATHPNPEPQLLGRRSHGRLLFGVAGGLADYLMVDPLLIRLSFVGLTVLGGAGVLLYLVLAVVLPVDGPGAGPEVGESDRSVLHSGAAQFLALCLVSAGAVLLARIFGWGSWVDWGQIWPLTLVAIGLSIMLRADRATAEAEPELDER